MKTYVRAIDINALAQRVEVDNRISLPFYYRIADNLLKQARIYRDEKSLIDLYIILLRYSSLLCETIPSHHGYQGMPLAFRKKLLGFMDELESLKPEVQHQVDELNQEHTLQSYCPKRVSNSSVPANRQSPLNFHSEQIPVSTSFSTLRPSNERNQIVSPDNLHSERSFQKMYLGCHPKEETLSRHSMLDPNGLWGHKVKPTSGVRVQYPSNFELIQSGSSRNQGLQSSSGAMNQNDSRKNNYDLESLLSHDDGRWSIPEEESGSFFHKYS